MKNQTQPKVKFFDIILDKTYEIGYNISTIKNKYFGRNTMTNAKNYTEEMVSEMTTAYTDNPTRETVK